MINIFRRLRKVRTGNFFDYSAREQKKIIKTAVRKANERQEALVREYSGKFDSK